MGNFFPAGADNPTYMKEPADKLINLIGATGLAIGIASILNGLYNMSNGINKVK
jgi:hypothetical protein